MSKPKIQACTAPLDKIRGTLLGLAVGDVLGAPLEGMLPETIKRRFGNVTELIDLPPSEVYDSHHWRLLGLHTDDTQQALTLAACLIEYEEIRAPSLLETWKQMVAVEIFTVDSQTGVKKRYRESFGCHRGTGSGFRHRLKKPSLPAPPNYSDGAAMRVAPVGIFFIENRSERMTNAIRSATASTSHPASIASAVAVCAAVATEDISAGEFFEAIIEETRTAEERIYDEFSNTLDPHIEYPQHGLSEILQRLATCFEKPLQVGMDEIVRGATAILKTDGLYATKGLALTAVPLAILIAARHLDDFKAGIVEAINLGGDTDTIAAIVGAILGAHLGIQAIPQSWQESVIARDEIIKTADLLLHTPRPGFSSSLIDLETRYTHLEASERKTLREKIHECEAQTSTEWIDIEVDVEKALKDLCELNVEKTKPSCDRLILCSGKRKIAELYWSNRMEREHTQTQPDGRIIGEGAADLYCVFRIAHAYDRSFLMEKLGKNEGDEIAAVYCGYISAGHLSSETIYEPDEALYPRYGKSWGYICR